MSYPNKFGSNRSKAQAVADISAPNSELGATLIADTNAHLGNWNAITALSASVAALVCNWDGTLSAVPLPVGVTVYGQFTSITLASGSVVAYKLPNP